MKKSIVVFFSRSGQNYFDGKIKDISVGNTAVVAQKIADIVKGDLFELEPLHPYSMNYQDTLDRSKQEITNDIKVKYKNIIDLEKYEDIYLGFPNWWSTYPMIIKTFLTTNSLDNKKIHVFVTHEGSGLGKVVNDLKQLNQKFIICPPLAIKGSSCYQCDELLNKWLNVK